jgi:hypothetical protein
MGPHERAGDSTWIMQLCFVGAGIEEDNLSIRLQVDHLNVKDHLSWASSRQER